MTFVTFFNFLRQIKNWEWSFLTKIWFFENHSNSGLDEVRYSNQKFFSNVIQFLYSKSRIRMVYFFIEIGIFRKSLHIFCWPTYTRDNGIRVRWIGGNNNRNCSRYTWRWSKCTLPYPLRSIKSKLGSVRLERILELDQSRSLLIRLWRNFVNSIG